MATEGFAIDNNGNAIHALRAGALTNAAVTVASAASVIPTGSKVVEVASNTDAWILFGTSGTTVSASTGMFLPKGVSVYQVDSTQTHIAHIRNADDGRISITRLY